MIFKDLCRGLHNYACVISVEKKDDGYGEIRIVDGNDKYLESFNYGDTKKEFIPNSIYTDLIEKNLNFENYCYRAAIKKELLHSYAYPKLYGAWFHMIYIPIDYEEDNKCYCLYIMDINNDFNSDTLSSSKNEIANKVLKVTLQLSDRNQDFKISLQKVLKDIREMCEAEFSCILILNDDKDELNVLAEDRNINGTKRPMKEYLDDDFYNLAKTWIDTLGDSNCLIISNESGMNFVKERNYKWYKSLVKSGVKSLVIFPLQFRERILGYIWVSDFKSDDTIKIKETLEITTFILESEIANYLLMNQLTFLSKIDLLTGVCNRNEMNNYVQKLADSNIEKNFGLFFLDINGLKHVNDELGHLEGDKLIKRAVTALKSIYKDIPIYRAGGDEFVIIIEDATQELLDHYKEEVKEKAKDFDVSFAVGYYIINNSKQIYKALKLADEAMYIDKKKYYDNK